jgi:hypothetical protein
LSELSQGRRIKILRPHGMMKTVATGNRQWVPHVSFLRVRRDAGGGLHEAISLCSALQEAAWDEMARCRSTIINLEINRTDINGACRVVVCAYRSAPFQDADRMMSRTPQGVVQLIGCTGPIRMQGVCGDGLSTTQLYQSMKWWRARVAQASAVAACTMYPAVVLCRSARVRNGPRIDLRHIALNCPVQDRTQVPTIPKAKVLSVLVDRTPFLCHSAPFGGPLPRGPVKEQAQSQWFHSLSAYKY